jgi:hypothetical protein
MIEVALGVQAALMLPLHRLSPYLIRLQTAIAFALLIYPSNPVLPRQLHQLIPLTTGQLQRIASEVLESQKAKVGQARTINAAASAFQLYLIRLQTAITIHLPRLLLLAVRLPDLAL